MHPSVLLYITLCALTLLACTKPASMTYQTTNAELIDSPSPLGSVQDDDDNYFIEVETTLHELRVSATLKNLEDHEILCLPAFGQRYAEKFTLISIKDTNEQLVQAKFNQSGCTQLSKATYSLQFNYSLSLDPLDQTHTWVASSLSPLHTEDYLAFPGESLFVERSTSTHHLTNVDIHFNDPTQSLIATSTLPSQVALETEQSFWAQDKFGLLRSYFVFGHIKPIEAVSEHSKVSIVLDRAFSVYAPVFLRESLSILEFYQNLMPEKAPESLSLFIFPSKHDAAQISGFARPNGIVLQLGKDHSAYIPERRLLLAHEIFHLYNGEQLHFAQSDYENSAWFREGSTQYIALKTIRELDLINQRQMLDLVGNFTTQMAESTHKSPVARDNSPSTPYLDGFFLSWLIDQQWSQVSTQLSMLNFWRFLAKSADWKSEKTIEWLQIALEEYSHFKFEQFFQKYVHPVRRIPVPFLQIIARAGVNATHFEQPKYDMGMTYQFDPVKAQFCVKQVLKNSIAQLAGFAPNQCFVPSADTNWKTGEDKTLIKAAPNGRFQQVRVPVERHFVPVYKLEP